MAHLMRRAGFGATRDELEDRAAKGYQRTVDELTDPIGFGVPGVDRDILYRYYPSQEVPPAPPDARGNLVYHMIASQRSLEEKMVLFWHQLFATGNAKVDN